MLVYLTLGGHLQAYSFTSCSISRSFAVGDLLLLDEVAGMFWSAELLHVEVSALISPLVASHGVAVLPKSACSYPLDDIVT